VPKSLQIDQYNLHVKFVTLNVDLNSPSLNSIGSKWPAHEGIKDGYPPKKLLFYHYQLRETSYAL